jgi:uncharacterized membrane protein YeiB
VRALSVRTRVEAIPPPSGAFETGVTGTDTESEVTPGTRVRAVTAPAGAVPLQERALAPDLARGVMLLLIALANVHLFLHGRPLGVRSYPAASGTPDRWVTGVQLLLVDGRAYPLFGLLLGYGTARLAARGAAAPAAEVVGLLRRRGLGLTVIGVAHVALLWSGDIVAAYGVLVVALAGTVVAGTAVSLGTTAAVGGVLGTFLGAFSGFSPAGTAALPSVAEPDPLAAAGDRLAEWGGNVLLSSLIGVVGAVALGAWAARQRLLDGDPTEEPPPGGVGSSDTTRPARQRRLLVRVAVAGLAGAVLGGLPLALAGAGVWRPGAGATMAAGALHTLGGYAGGLGYAAAFGLLAARVAHPPGAVVRALVACGQRSLSCYLGQSVLFAALLPACTLDLGARLTVAQAALLAVAVWLVLLLAAVAAARAGHRGPAEVLLRRITYGRG